MGTCLYQEDCFMYCISFNDIIELNGILKNQGLHFRIHLRDACGKQSCWIEPLGNCACEGHFDEMYQVLEDFFAGKGASIEYDESRLNFWILA